MLYLEKKKRIQNWAVMMLQIQGRSRQKRKTSAMQQLLLVIFLSQSKGQRYDRTLQGFPEFRCKETLM